MSTTTQSYCSVYGCENRMSRLAIVKGLLYALIMASVTIVGIVYQGNPTYLGVVFLFSILLIFGLEVNTVTLGNIIEIDFDNSDDD